MYDKIRADAEKGILNYSYDTVGVSSSVLELNQKKRICRINTMQIGSI
jgi:hypothetical protein